MPRTAPTDHPIHELIAKRWSPCAFDPRPIPREDLCSLFEAARWAASSFNEQPWRFVVATNEDPEAYAKMSQCIMDVNLSWAKDAGALVLATVARRLSSNGKPNSAAHHDLGLAVANLTLEATARGLMVHEMVGIHPEKARETYGVPEDADVVEIIAVGYPGDSEALPEKLKARDQSPRQRKPLSEFVFSGAWGAPSSLVL